MLSGKQYYTFTGFIPALLVNYKIEDYSQTVYPDNMYNQFDYSCILGFGYLCKTNRRTWMIKKQSQ